MKKIKKLLRFLKFNELVISEIDKLEKRGLPIKYIKALKLTYAILKFTLAVKINYVLSIFIALVVLFLRGTSDKLDKLIKPKIEEIIIKLILRVAFGIFSFNALKIIGYIMF